MIVAPWEPVEQVPVKAQHNGDSSLKNIPFVSVETTTNTVTCISRHRVDEHPQQ